MLCCIIGLEAYEHVPAAERTIVFSLRKERYAAATRTHAHPRLLLPHSLHTHRRIIANEDEVVQAVTSDPQLQMVKFVNFGNMSVREQLRTALQASAIAGVHGQGPCMDVDALGE